MAVHRMAHKFGNRLTVALFLLILVLPALDMALGLDSTPKVQGMFKPPQLELSPRGLLKLPFDFKAWFAENFGFRAMLIQQHGLFKDRVLDMSPSQRVVRGDEGWYFFNDESVMQDYRNLYPFDEEGLQVWTTMLEGRYRFCKDRGVPYLFTISPNKHSIYPEHLPSEYYKVRPGSRLDDLAAAMAQKHPEVPFIDPRPQLLAGKEKTRIYHKTDTHWNKVGSYLAYLEVLKALKLQFPELELPPQDFEIDKGEVDGGDLARFMGLKFVLKEESIWPVIANPRQLRAKGMPNDFLETADLTMTQLIETTCESGEIESGIIFHDSFGRAMLPYLAVHFKRAHFVWSNDFSPNLVEQEQPAVVIQQLVERRLLGWTPPPNEFNEPEVAEDSQETDASETESSEGEATEADQAQ